jgi:hypothetical protein
MFGIRTEDGGGNGRVFSIFAHFSLLQGNHLARHSCGCFRIIHTISLNSQLHAMAKNLTTSTAHIQHSHPRLHLCHSKCIPQPSRQMFPF